MDFHHVPVLLDETIQGLSIKPSGTYVDCTLGGGGHGFEIARRLGPQGLFIGIDQDGQALEAAREKLGSLQVRKKFVRKNFEFLDSVLEELSVSKVDGFLADLGVSSFQLDTPERGFSYQHDALLDMRMDDTSGFTAGDIVNSYSEKELEKIFWEYGEERWARRIAGFIVGKRKISPVKTTGELVEIVKAAIPANARRTGPHPAKRVFQALRIEVNNEMEVLRRVLHQMVRFAAPRGRICIISFHSLEDRIVKDTFRDYTGGCICPPDFPQCVCGRSALLKVVNRKPIEASDEERETNPRARSAKLRVAEKLQ